MSDRPALSRRVPPPRAPLAAVANIDHPPSTEPAQDDIEELREQLAELKDAKRAADALAAEAKKQASAAERKVAKLEDRPPAMIERSYAGTMQRPHTKSDGLTYRRTTLSIPEAMDKAIDFYIKSSGGRWRDRSAFLKTAAEEYLKTHPLEEKGTPVDAYLAMLEE